ncbi:MAG: GGDEF domain-containing protein [Deltaproteobacteria bacterium]|nr:GGDEF domain-containing protein [Deltaproteobacteria bacterium]
MAMNLKKGFPLFRKRFYFLLYLVYLTAVALFLLINYQLEKSQLLEAIDSRLLVAAKGVKHMLAEDFHDRALAPGSIAFSEEMINRKKINTFANEADFAYIYTLVPREGKFYFSAPTVTEEEARKRESWYFYPYLDIPSGFVEAFQEKLTRFVTYSDQWGHFRSVAVPEVTPLGRTYLVCADMKLKDFHQALWWRNLIHLAHGVAFLVLSVPFIVLYRRDNFYLKSLNRDLNQRGLELERMVLNRTLDLSQARKERVRAEREFRQFFNDAVVGIFRVDAHGRLLLANPKLAEMLGYQDQPELLADGAFDGSLFTSFQEEADIVPSGESQHYYYRETEFSRKSGGKIWISISSRKELDGDGKIFLWEGFAMDITERKRYENDIRRMALEDYLTGLPNRKSFMESLAKAIKMRQRNSHYGFGVLMIDLDDFKRINDTWGHLLGDRFLVEIAKRMLSVVRANDTVARLGGDEFAVLLSDLSDIKEVWEVAERLIQEVSCPIVLEGKDFFVTASVGMVEGTENREAATDFLRDADIAMYQAKASGKNRICLFGAGVEAPS